MIFTRTASAILRDWRQVMRHLQAVEGDSFEAAQLNGEAEGLRREYHDLIAEAARAHEPALPPFPAVFDVGDDAPPKRRRGRHRYSDLSGPTDVGDQPTPDHDRVRNSLDDWRDAERDADKKKPDSAARKMARKRADAAREDFHEAEDVEREVQGNHRPRKHESDESQEAESQDTESTG